MSSKVICKIIYLGIWAIGCQVVKWKLAEMVMGFDRECFLKKFIYLFIQRNKYLVPAMGQAVCSMLGIQEWACGYCLCPEGWYPSVEFR